MTSYAKEGLPADLTSWLGSLPLSSHSTEPNSATGELESGQLVGDIVKLLRPESNTLELTNGSTLMNRQSNWNALSESLAPLGIKLSPEERSKLTNGDREQLVGLLQKLRELELKQRRESEVDITKLDPKKELRAASSLLEMLLLVLMRNFNLSSKECVTLLSSQGKYLAHILAKGMKGQFGPVQGLYLELSKNLTLFIALSKDKESKEFVFKALKPGVISKSERVSLLSFDLLTGFLKAQPNAHELFKQLFASTAFLGVRRHKSLVGRVVKTLMDVTNCGTDTLDIIKEFADDQDLLACYSEMYQLAEQRDQLAEVENMVGWQSLVSSIVDTAGRASNKQQSQYLQLIQSFVRGGSKALEESNPLKLFSALCDSRAKITSQCQKAHSLTFLFECLAELGRSKNALAPLLYKQMAGLLHEMLMSQEGEAYCLNMATIVEEFPKIPLGMLLESFASTYSQNEQSIELAEHHIKLLSVMADSDEIDLKNTLLLLDICTKIQLNNAVFAPQIAGLICRVVQKVADEEIVQELLNKFIKISLAIYYANEKKKEPKRKSLVPGKNKDSSADVAIRLKNNVIYYTLDKILALKLTAVNEAALPLIGFTIIQLRSMGSDRPELLMRLLGHYGNPEEVIREFEPQQQEQPVQPANDDFQLTEKKTKPQSTARINMVTPKVLQGLEKYHKSYVKKVQQAEALEKAKQEEQQRRAQLKKTMELKMLQQGLTLRSDQQIELVFEFDSREKLLKLEKPHKHNEVSYFDLQNEEERDSRAIDYLQKKFHKAIRYLYVRYSNSIGDVKAHKDFDDFAQKTQTIKAVDVWKMLKEHNLDDFITIFECQELVKLVNYRSGNKTDPLVLDFAGFERCLLQIAVFMFSRPPKDLRVNPPSLLYEEMFRMMRDKCEKTGINPQLFDDPDTAYFSESQVIRDLNRKLVENPNHILPEGYKKIIEKKVDFQYNLSVDAVGTAYKDVYEIIDELLFTEFNFHVIQPFTKVSTKAKARPALYYVNEKKEEDLGRSQERLRVRSEVEKTKISQTLRNELARYPMKERAVATKVAAVVEEMLFAVEFGHDQIGLKPENIAVKSKKEREQEQKKLKEAEDLKRKQRQEELKKQLQEVKDKRSEKEKAEEERKQKEEEKRKEQQEKRKQKEKEVKAKLAEYQSKKKEDEEQEKKAAEEKKQKEKEEEARKKKETQEAKRKIEEAKKKREEEEQQKKEEEEKEKRKKKAYEQKLFKEKQKQLKEKIKEYKNTKGESKPQQKKQEQANEEVKAIDS